MEESTFPAPSLDTWTTLFVLAAAQGLFLTITLVFSRKGHRPSNLILAGFIALFSLTLIEYVLHWTRYIYYLPQVNSFYLVFVFFFGPLLLLYFQSIESGRKLSWKSYLHLLPGLLFFLNRLPYYLSPFEARQAIITGDAAGLSLLNRPFINLFPYHEYLINGHLIGYCLLLFFFLKRHRLWQKLPEEASSIHVVKRKWYRTLFWLFTGFVLANASYYILIKMPFFSIEWDYGISLAMTVFIYTVGYLGYRQTEIFDGRLLQKMFIPQKYQSSSLTPSASQSMVEKVLDYFEEHQPYLDNDLRLSALAQQLDLSVHHLSQVINEQLGKSFPDFVNEYRVEAARKMLENPEYEQQYIINIAYDCGFNNKTSFNKAFKQHTGMAPSAYRSTAMAKAKKSLKKRESI